MGILSPQISQVAMKYSTELYSFFIVIFTVIFVELCRYHDNRIRDKLVSYPPTNNEEASTH